jgi:hypothetical protein
MRFTRLLILTAAAAILTPTSAVMASAPSFGSQLYADGETWGTKGTTVLPAPNEHNLQSFDILYVIKNSNNPAGQLPVAEAAPGNPDYNGGRWFTHTAEWTEEAFNGYVPVLKSAAEVEHYADMGLLIITPGSFPGGPNVYFQCPLLPDKSQR